VLITQAAHELGSDLHLADSSILLGKDPWTFVVPRTGLQLTVPAMFLDLILQQNVVCLIHSVLSSAALCFYNPMHFKQNSVFSI